jgi:hypothetical protein
VCLYYLNTHTARAESIITKDPSAAGETRRQSEIQYYLLGLEATAKQAAERRDNNFLRLASYANYPHPPLGER